MKTPKPGAEEGLWARALHLAASALAALAMGSTGAAQRRAGSLPPRTAQEGSVQGAGPFSPHPLLSTQFEDVDARGWLALSMGGIEAWGCKRTRPVFSIRTREREDLV